MKPPSDTERQTLRYYEEHAEEYVRQTVDLDVRHLYAPFLEHVPSGGRILDAGCGSGRDTKAFLEMGYDVVAIDASPAMAAAAAKIAGIPVQVMRLQEIDFESEFDGVWACASLLHVPRGEAAGAVLEGFCRALKPGGVCYVSVKEGRSDRVEDGRYFVDFDAQGIRDLLMAAEHVDVLRVWTTEDVAGHRQPQPWINVVFRRSSRDFS